MTLDLLALGFLGAIAVGSLPKLRMNRATIALVGATLLVSSGSVTMDEALGFINAPTLLLLLAMMVLNSNLSLAGFFNLVAAKIQPWTSRPRLFLLQLMVVTAALSAFLVNDTLIMVFTPLLVAVLLRAKLPPYPYLMGLAFSTNIGSMATFIGNPQNILIGTSSNISFLDFFFFMGPISLILVFVAWALIQLLSGKDFTKPLAAAPDQRAAPRIYRPLLFKCTGGFVVMIAAFVLGFPVSLAALLGISLILVTRRIHPEKVFSRIDWSLLVFFAGLFVFTGVLRTSEFFFTILPSLREFFASAPLHLGWIGASMSQIISNVPTVMLLSPVVASMPDPDLAWLLLSGVTTLAGNFTLLGSVANLIMAENAARNGIKISFFAYFKLGLPVTVITILLFLGYTVVFFH